MEKGKGTGARKITMKEAARRLGVSLATAYRMAELEVLPAERRIGRCMLVDEADLLRVLREGGARS